MTRLARAESVLVVLAVVLASCGRPAPSGDEDAGRGIQLLEAGRHQEAADTLEAALEKGLTRAEYEVVYTCLGLAYSELGELDKAISAHEKSIDVNPEFHKAWVNLGIAHRLKGELSEAERCYLTALELEPDYAELHASIGALCIFRAKYEEAVGHLEKATRLDSQLPVGWANLALAYATVGRFPEAETALKRAVVLGYESGPQIRQRIDALRASQPLPDANGHSPAGSE